MVILIAVPVVTWLANRPDGDETRPVLVVNRAISAFSMLNPGDLKVEMREAAAGQLPAEFPLAMTVALKDLPVGAVVATSDVASIGVSTALPRDPVALRIADPATLPATAAVGGRVIFYGVASKQEFTVPGVLLSRENGAVFLVSRGDAKNFGAVLASGKVVAIVDVVPR
ncbi:hypothetical protein OG558_37695 [Kribbella sp. NBC_01510]|uniref:hypothetical protein n=1 Tax=Kribbella sp. NBC_01510 TaxID=2903581 RepID=UPI003863CC40